MALRKHAIRFLFNKGHVRVCACVFVRRTQSKEHRIFKPLYASECTVLWLQNCCEAAVVSLACQLTPSALHMKEPVCVGGQEKERTNVVCGGRAGTAVYLSPPCRNLYRTLRALIKDHTEVCSIALPRAQRQNKNPGTHIRGTYVINDDGLLDAGKTCL